MSASKSPGYHITEIKKGQLGELSKIQEELDEAKDAEEQGIKVMLLNELSDIIGAVDAYLENHYPYLTIEDLKGMSDVTKRAFKSGARASKD